MTAAKFVLELTLIFNSRWTRNTDESPKLSSRQIKWKTLGLILTSVMPNIVGLIKMLFSIFRISFTKSEMTRYDEENMIRLSFYKDCINYIFFSSIVNFF